MPSTIDQFLEDSLRNIIDTAATDSRHDPRCPFFRPVTVTVGGAQGTKLSAFSRDLSPTGIGLLHNMPLETHRVTLSIPVAAGQQVDLSTEITWCEPCGEGWYLSGGRFLGLSRLQVIALRLATGVVKVHRRLKQRQPFFRQVTITSGGAQRTQFSAFSRDISREGIGLLHSMPLEAHRVTLSIPTTASDRVELSTEITWCAPCGEGWYLSGGRFTTLSIQELHDFLR